VLQWVAVGCSELHYFVVSCIVLQFIAVCCSVLQCVAVPHLTTLDLASAGFVPV